MNSKDMILQDNDKNITTISNILKNGGVVAIPTETVYGLAARADSDIAIKKIFATKNRPLFNPLIVHFKNKSEALNSIISDERAQKLAKKFWPGPLTIVGFKKKNSTISKIATSGLKTIAIRVPEHEALKKLFKIINFPLAAPSANKFGKLSSTSAYAVREEFGNGIDYILDGGKSKVGIESTIVDISTVQSKLLRYGAINHLELKNVLGKVLKPKIDSHTITAPGMLKKHYQPNTPLRINANYPLPGEAWLGFGKLPKNFKGPALSLSKSRNYSESAFNLYTMLRNLDSMGVSRIAVETIPNKGLGMAINDRLIKASTENA